MTDSLVTKILRVIQRTADAQGNVTMLRLAENIASDLTVATAPAKSPIKCESNCNPLAEGVRSEGAVHYIDCPVWDYLQVDPYVVWRDA